jgi:hypothetical protein
MAENRNVLKSRLPASGSRVDAYIKSLQPPAPPHGRRPVFKSRLQPVCAKGLCRPGLRSRLGAVHAP